MTECNERQIIFSTQDEMNLHFLKILKQLCKEFDDKYYDAYGEDIGDTIYQYAAKKLGYVK
jgi:hypothetical protein